MPIPDYSNLKMNLEGLNTFFKDNGVKVSSSDSAKINTIFKECDTENEQGEKKPDGILTTKERTNFLSRIKTLCPDIYQKVVDFVVTVEVKEELEKNQQETIDKKQQVSK